MKPYRHARLRKSINRRLIAGAAALLLVMAGIAASPPSWYATDPASVPARFVP